MAGISQARRIIVATDVEAMARMAAERLIARIAQASGQAAICLTGGSGPQPLYRLLAREPYRSRLQLDRTHWFMGDDRFVPTDDALSNIGTARRLFLDPAGAPAENIHAIAADCGSPDAAARLYEAELKRFYGRDRLDPARPLFDFVLMGLAPDGHTASLFPHAAALAERERRVVGVDEAGLAPFVPRVTLTFPALASTREMLFLVTGEEKREILSRVLAGEDLPASRARAEGEMVWLIEAAAAPADLHAT
ncbi:MAG TPA: 6-phosphogluconolactonase [Pseudomonadota bacterium]|nr:6-phosphogluconolactonase [Pseudomonadota bacterium]